MRWKLIGSLAFLGSVLIPSGMASAVASGDVLPTIEVKHHESGQLDQAKLNGKVTVINFWATWCAACKVELKEMEDQFKVFGDEKDFHAAYVSLDKDPNKAVEWFGSNLKDPAQMLKSLYLDSAFQAAEKLKVESFPMTFVIDKNGKIAKIHEGFKEGENSTEEIAKVVAELLRQ
jgi:peroxiredoxin